MATLGIEITAYKTLVTPAGIVMEVVCKTTLQDMVFVVTLQPADVMSILADATIAIRAAEEPADPTAAAMLMQTEFGILIFAKMAALGYMTA